MRYVGSRDEVESECRKERSLVMDRKGAGKSDAREEFGDVFSYLRNHDGGKVGGELVQYS